MNKYLLILTGILILIVIVLVAQKYANEGFNAITPGSQPNFLYANQLQQLPGPEGWGCVNQDAVKRTLLWEESRPRPLMPSFLQSQPTGYFSHLVNSAPVERATNDFSDPNNKFRPPVFNVQQTAQEPIPVSTF